MISLLYRLADRARNRVRVRRNTADQASGRRGEDLAHRFLRRQGFKIVARNFRARCGRVEIDVIGWDQDKLVFLEVKSRANDEFGTPDRAVDAEKQSRIYRRRGNIRGGQTWNGSTCGSASSACCSRIPQKSSYSEMPLVRSERYNTHVRVQHRRRYS